MVRAGETVLVHGAGRVSAMGASTVADCHQQDWPEQVRTLTGGGADAAANAARGGSIDAVRAVRDRGRLATITDLPDVERGITMRAVLVVPDGARLAGLAQLLAEGALTVTVTDSFPLERAAAALTQARRGAHGTATVPRTRPSRGAA